MGLPWKDRKTFYWSYLKKMKVHKRVTKKNVYNLAADAELWKFWGLVDGLMNDVGNRCKLTPVSPEYIKPWLIMNRVWQKAVKKWSSKKKLVEMSIFHYLNYIKDKEWDAWVKGPCGKTIPYLQKKFRDRENFTTSFVFKGANPKKLLKFVKNTDSWAHKLHDKKMISTLKKWNYKKSGVKFHGLKMTNPLSPKNPFYISNYFKRNTGNRFVVGGSGKSGYPYAMMTGFLNYSTSKTPAGTKLTISGNGVHQMGMDIGGLSTAYKNVIGGIGLTLKQAWNEHVAKKRRLQK